MNLEPDSDILGRAPWRGMRVAVVHDWLSVYAGAERVLEQILQIFPHADLFALIDFLPPELRHCILDKPVHTSFLQNMPFIAKRYRAYLALMPLAIEQFDLSDYDLVISSSHAVAKGVLTGPHQLHVSYVHSPIRYAWDLQHQYLHEAGLDRNLRGWIARWMLHRIRIWDARTANGVDCFIANSNYIRRRIEKTYRRDSTVVYPPVDIDRFAAGGEREDYYFTASRMVPYKRMDLIVEAFSAMPDKRLVVIGDGPEMARIRNKAAANIELLGYRSDKELLHHMQHTRAFVFAAEEDFGIVPVEAQACGTPVIAYGRGGVRETVRDLGSLNPTGVLFNAQTVEALTEAVHRFETEGAQIRPEHCRANAERFSPLCFRQRFSEVVEQAMLDFNHWQQNSSEISQL
jgi:glycosyltransferase involved in cell wall biosynthesis